MCNIVSYQLYIQRSEFKKETIREICIITVFLISKFQDWKFTARGNREAAGILFLSMKTLVGKQKNVNVNANIEIKRKLYSFKFP